MTVSQLLVNFVITQRRCRTSKLTRRVEETFSCSSLALEVLPNYMVLEKPHFHTLLFCTFAP
jgi:hypothetical protein